MNKITQGAPVAPPLLTHARIRLLHSTALRIHEPLGRVLELACLLPCPVADLALAPIELVDWNAEVAVVHADAGLSYEVALGSHGAAAARIASGGHRRGPLIREWDDVGLVLDDDAHDYCIELAGLADPRTTEFAWDLNLLQQSVAHQLFAAGSCWTTIMAQMGMVPVFAGPGTHTAQAALLEAQARSAERWGESLVGGALRSGDDCACGLLLEHGETLVELVQP